MDNAQKLWTLREKYKKLEQNYFTLEKSGSRKYEEFEDLVKKKEKEQITLEIMTNIYENHLIKDLNLFELRNLETKILRSIDSIKDRKQRCIRHRLTV